MDLDFYNQSFDETLEHYAAEAEYKLQVFRQQCVKDFIDRLNKRQREWDATYQAILRRSIDEDEKNKLREEKPRILNPLSTLNSSLSQSFQPTNLSVPKQDPPVINLTRGDELNTSKPIHLSPVVTEAAAQTSKLELQVKEPKKEPEQEFTDPRFSNVLVLNEFLRIRNLLEQNRAAFSEIVISPNLKSLKNELNIFIRTQINSISNSDNQHLATKIQNLTTLFRGENVTYQARLITASQHPHGQLFSMDLAAQTFVTVGTRLANSVPAIAKSMATVVNGIIDNNLPLFKDLIIGHLHERCPYLVPMYPKLEDFSNDANDSSIKYKIACGYAYDTKTQTLESEDKYISRLRSMVLIFACILSQKYANLAWTWLAAFLSLKPQPVITATVLQAFLQEASKKLSSIYGRQYTKLLAFIKKDYLSMIETVTSKTSDRQSLIKLRNLLSDDSNLISAPSVGSIFGAIRYR